MKSFAFALLFVVVAVSASREITEKWNKVHKTCQETDGLFVPEDIFEKLKKGENPPLPANFGAHAYCMLNKLGFQDGQGHILGDEIERVALLQNIDPAKATSIATECSADKGSKEENALSMFDCCGKYKIDIGQF